MSETNVDLANKGAIITGGGSGINLAFAKTIFANGCAVLIADLALHTEATAWLNSVKTGPKPKALFRKTDVTSWEQLESLFDAYAQEFGGVPDIVVAGAGIYEASSAGFWNEDDKASHYLSLDVNVAHPIRLTRIAVRRLRRAGKPGVILHESSITALKPSVVLPLYAVGKAALSHFVRCMAPLEEMAGIKVVAVAPGIVDTPLFRDSPKALAHIDTETDVFLPSEEVVRAMMALLTDAAYRGGTVLEVNDIGGWRQVQLVNDPGPQGRSRNPRAKALEAVAQVKNALDADAEDRGSISKL